MLDTPFQAEFPEIRYVHCISLRCGDRKVGMLTLYLADREHLEPEIEEFLRTIVDETALGLESLRLREREISALQQLQSVHQKTDLEGMVTGLLEHIQQSMEAEYIMLNLIDRTTGAIRLSLVRGTIDRQIQSFAEGVLHGVYQSEEPVMLNNVGGSARSKKGLHSILSAPLLLQDQRVVGALLVGNGSPSAFSRRQLELLQTLGFLKMQIGQLQNYLRQGEMARLEAGLQTSYATLADAYVEVRDAIDGLRTNPADENIQVWLAELLAEFGEATGIDYDVHGIEELCHLPPEVQIQLIRIVQEALSNVRKHAHAPRITVSCWRTTGEFVLEVQDDGRGFTPGEVSNAAQYGLRGMRERCELIGAEFQVISKPHDGTRIRIGMYMPNKERANNGS
jgi:two-component system nitrate/nitrite sensor histidine kinase NarX